MIIGDAAMESAYDTLIRVPSLTPQIEVGMSPYLLAILHFFVSPPPSLPPFQCDVRGRNNVILRSFSTDLLC